MADEKPTVTFYNAAGDPLTVANKPDLIKAAESKGWKRINPGDTVRWEGNKVAGVTGPSPVAPGFGKAVSSNLAAKQAASTADVSKLSQPPEKKFMDVFLGSEEPSEAAGGAAAMLAVPFLAPEAGLLKRMLATTAAGTAGDVAARGLTQHKFDPSSSILTGLEFGAAPELLTWPIGKFVERFAAGRMGKLPGERLPGQSVRHTPAELDQLVGDWERMYRSTKGVGGNLVKDRVNELAANDILDLASGDMATLGTNVKETISRVGAPAFKEVTQELVGEMRNQTYGITVDITPLQQEASRLLTEATQLYHSGVSKKGKPIQVAALAPPPKLLQLYNSILKLPSKLEFMSAPGTVQGAGGRTGAFELRKRLLEDSKEPEELIGSKVKGVYSHLVNRLTELMDAAVANDPAAMNSWLNFRTTYKDGASVLQDKLIKGMLTNYPEKVAEAIGKNATTPAKEIYQALVGFAEENARRNPSPSSQLAVQQGQQALKRFRNVLIQTKLADGGIVNLAKHLDEIGKPALDVLFRTDPEGAALLERTTRIAEKVAALNDAANVRQLSLFYQLRAIPNNVMGRILANPRSAKLYLDGVSGFLRESQRPYVRKFGETIYKVSPQATRYMAQIARAWELVDSVTSNVQPVASHKPSDLLKQSPLYQQMQKQPQQQPGQQPPAGAKP